MKKLLVIFFALSFLFLTKTAHADVTCEPIYGGGITCPQQGNLVISKKVLNPQTNNLVHTLDINGAKFSPGQIVTFQLTVTNTGNAVINNITVKDIFPQFVDFLTGNGNFDSNTKTLTFNIAKLNPGESQNFNLQGKIVSIEQMPSDQSIVCVVNQAIATANESGQQSQDNSQFCIQKITVTPTPLPVTKGGLKVFPPQQVTVTPPTGPEMIPLLALIPTGLTGLIIRKKSNKND